MIVLLYLKAFGLAILFLNLVNIMGIPHLGATSDESRKLLTDDFLLYQSPTYGVSIHHPYDWEVTQNHGRITFYPDSISHSDKIGDYLDIIVISSENMRLHELISREINDYRQNYPGFKLIDLVQTTLVNNPAYKITYSYQDGQEDITRMILVTVKDGVAYFIVYHAQTAEFFQYLPTVERMIGSFQINLPLNSNSQIPQEIGNLDQIGQHILGIAGIKVGGVPVAVAINPNTKILYVSNSRSNTISAIDTTNDRIVANITVDNLPYGIAVNQFENTIYVANFRSNTVSVIDGATNRVVDTVKVGENPIEVAVNPDTNTIYVANFRSNTVSVINGLTNLVEANITLGGRPSSDVAGIGLAIDLFRNIVYVAKTDSDSVSVIDGSTNKVVANITVGDSPSALAVDSNTNMVYVANSDSDSVSVIDGSTNRVVHNISVGSKPHNMGSNLYTNMVYVANSDSDSVSVIDGSMDKVLTNISVGKGPQGLSVDPDTNTIYVVNFRSNTVTMINGTTNKIIVGTSFNIYPPNSGHIYCNQNQIANSYIKNDINTQLNCQAKPNSFLGIFPPIVFDSWSGDLATQSKNNPEITLPVTHYGTLVANFKEVIPSEYLTTEIIIPVMLGIILPGIAAWIFAKKRRSYLFRYLKTIEAAHEAAHKNKEESLQRLSQIRKEITELFNKGKISEDHYGMLDNKISEYYDKVTEE
jgi:YVTN family beta-propeller protein